MCHRFFESGYNSNLNYLMLLIKRICLWFCNMLCAFFMKRDTKEGLLVFNIIGLALIIFYLFWPFQTDTALKSIQWVLKFKITVLQTVPTVLQTARQTVQKTVSQRQSHRDRPTKTFPTEIFICPTETVPNRQSYRVWPTETVLQRLAQTDCPTDTAPQRPSHRDRLTVTVLQKLSHWAFFLISLHFPF